MPKEILKSILRSGGAKLGGYVRFEILGLVDISSFSQELKDHYRSHVLPLVQKLHPDGPAIHFAFRMDPPAIEIRKMVGWMDEWPIPAEYDLARKIKSHHGSFPGLELRSGFYEPLKLWCIPAFLDAYCFTILASCADSGQRIHHSGHWIQIGA